jgi:hypothetical protein
MVVRALWTPLKAARQAKNQLNRIGCTIIGAILNGISHSRGYYPYYYGYYRYYAYKYSYDEETTHKFSLREFGLRIESKFKSIVQTTRLSLPHWAASSQNFARHIIKRKTFWLLLCLSIGFAVFNTMKNYSGMGVLPKQSITFLGNGQPKENNVSVELKSPSMDSPKAIPLKNQTLSSFADSLAFWQNAYNTKNVERYLAFYDNAHFHYPGGNFATWETQTKNTLLQDSSRNSIIHIDSLWNDSIELPYYSTSVNATRTTAKVAENVCITFIWQNTDNCWRIIREKQRTR